MIIKQKLNLESLPRDLEVLEHSYIFEKVISNEPYIYLKEKRNGLDSDFFICFRSAVDGALTQIPLTKTEFCRIGTSAILSENNYDIYTFCVTPATVMKCIVRENGHIDAISITDDALDVTKNKPVSSVNTNIAQKDLLPPPLVPDEKEMPYTKILDKLETEQIAQAVSSKSSDDAKADLTDHKDEETEGKVNQDLLDFLDADTYAEKLNVLAGLRSRLDDSLINNIAASLDVHVPDGPIDERFLSLKICLETYARFEFNR